MLADLRRESVATLKALWAALRSREGLVLVLAAALFGLYRVVYRNGAVRELLRDLVAYGHHRAIREQVSTVIFYGVAPLLLVLLLHRADPRRMMGLRLPDRRWLLVTGAAVVAVVALAPLWAQLDPIARGFPLLKPARSPGPTFWWWQLLAVAGVLSTELMLRGYLLFGLEERFGAQAILIQLIPYVVIHTRRPEGAVWLARVAGLGLGSLAWASRPVWPAVIVHVAGAVALALWLVYGGG